MCLPTYVRSYNARLYVHVDVFWNFSTYLCAQCMIAMLMSVYNRLDRFMWFYFAKIAPYLSGAAYCFCSVNHDDAVRSLNEHTVTQAVANSHM